MSEQSQSDDVTNAAGPVVSEAPGLVVQRDVGERGIVVHVTGEVDMSGAPALAEQLAAAVALAATTTPRLVVIDLGAVDFFGSSGLSAVLACHKAGVESGVVVRIVATTMPVLRAIEVTELQRVLDVDHTLEQALRPVEPDSAR